MRRPPLRSGEAGISLVEVLVSVAIMGIAFIAVVGGMSTAAIGSDVHRKQATSDTVVRSFVEAVKAASYVPCADEDDYAPEALGYGVPDGYEAGVADVRFWKPSPGDAATGSFKVGCSADTGLQKIDVIVGSSDARASLARTILKRRP